MSPGRVAFSLAVPLWLSALAVSGAAQSSASGRTAAQAASAAPLGIGRPATAAEIERFKRQLAQGIREERRSAKEGDVFTADIAPQFRGIIRADLKSRDVEDALAAVAEVSPRLALYVNDPWPRDLPRATVPPRLLASLHPLPEGVEYRFLSRHLVLLDSDADLIIDLVRNVIPSSVRREP